MKTFSALILGLFVATGVFAKEEVNEADVKWKAAVAEMIAKGPTTISTPLERRMEIAKELAKKAGRTAEVKRTETSYRITVQ